VLPWSCLAFTREIASATIDFAVVKALYKQEENVSAVVILLMFLAVMIMVRNIEAEREHQRIAATDSSEMELADRIPAQTSCGNKFSSRASEPTLLTVPRDRSTATSPGGSGRNAPVTL
jgi:hypothetical protein